MITINDQLRLRSWKEEDKNELQRLANNYNVSKNLREIFPFPYTMNDAENWIFLSTTKLQDTHFCIQYNGKPTGGIGIVIKNDIHKYTAELGYWLGEEYWGRGIMTECIRAVTHYFMEKFELKRIFATVFSENIVSAKALERCGYKYEGTLIKYALKNGVDLDGLMYAYT